MPRISIANVSVISGAVSDVYGSGALGGVINIETKRIENSFFDSEVSLGSEKTFSGSAIGGMRYHKWGLTVSSESLRTEGYVLVPKNEGGLIDTPAGTAGISGSLSLTRALSPEGRFFLRSNLFGESRRNGTLLQINNTRISELDLGIDQPNTSIGDLSVRVYGSHEIFNQTFSAVAVDRNSESLTNQQKNPSQQFGFAFQWRRSFAIRHRAVAGVEVRDVRGHSAEITFAASRVTAHVDAGGRQRIIGAFGQDSVRAGQWLFTLGARIDRWTNGMGFSNRIPVTGSSSLSNFVDRSDTAFSPRLSVSRRFDSGVWIDASIYRAFRAPTLNELYRNFRVGNIVTNANADLRAERLTGGEAGINFQKFSERLTLRGNVFWSEVNDAVANVTLASTPALITRQRQNVGAIRARGLEASAEIRPTSRLRVSTEYLLTDSTVLRFPVNRSLVGLLVPQTPRHQLNFQISYEHAKWRFGWQGRIVGEQFDDDQNLLPLKRFFTVDTEVSRVVSSKLEVFAAVQNLTNTRYEIARSPVVNVGPPLLARVGVRIHLR